MTTEKQPLDRLLVQQTRGEEVSEQAAILTLYID
jgi:hypothetical protein